MKLILTDDDGKPMGPEFLLCLLKGDEHKGSPCCAVHFVTEREMAGLGGSPDVRRMERFLYLSEDDGTLALVGDINWNSRRPFNDEVLAEVNHDDLIASA